MPALHVRRNNPNSGETYMSNMDVIHNWQFDKMRKMLVIYDDILRDISPETATTLRDGGDGWTVTEVLCHLRDAEESFLRRAQVTLEQDSPDLPVFDPDALAAEKKYNTQEFRAVHGEWTQQRESFLELLEGIEATQWERVGIHPRRGATTLDDQLFLVTWHDVLHLDQIMKILHQRSG
jgi:uncharacterized damage-inducible protein DinB